MPKPESRSAVDFSRVLGRSDATTLALSICFTVSALVSMPVMLSVAAEEAEWLYLLAIPVYLPVLLALSDRAAQAQQMASLYHLSRLTEGSARPFFAGWLKLGGYATIGAALLAGIMLSVDT